MPRRDVLTPQGEKGLPSLSRRMGVCTTPMPRSLTALLCPISRSGARQAVAHCGGWLPEALRLLGLGALLAILGALALAGCYISRTIDQATASDVNNRNFTFTSGEGFHSALQNVATGLVFSNNALNFTLSSAGAVSVTASGTSSVIAGSCSLTVTKRDDTSNTGPRVGTTIRLNPCTYNSSNNTLTVTSATGMATSQEAILQ